MLKFHPLTIADRTFAADDAVALSFAVPAPLRDDFRFLAGQHLALRLPIEGQEERRTYSIVNPEGANRLTIGVRVQRDGRMSQYLARFAAIGETIDVLTPNGSFHAETGVQGPQFYAAFAAGRGITPVLSIAATSMAQADGFTLTTEVRALPTDPWSSSVFVSYGQPFFVRFTMTKVTGVSSTFGEVSPDNNLLTLSVAPTSQTLVQFGSERWAST